MDPGPVVHHAAITRPDDVAGVVNVIRTADQQREDLLDRRGGTANRSQPFRQWFQCASSPGHFSGQACSPAWGATSHN